MSDEELLLFNDIYNQTQHFGRTQFVREIMKLQKENKELQERINKAIEYLEAKRIREKAIVDIDVLEGILKEVE